MLFWRYIIIIFSISVVLPKVLKMMRTPLLVSSLSCWLPALSVLQPIPFYSCLLPSPSHNPQQHLTVEYLLALYRVLARWAGSSFIYKFQWYHSFTLTLKVFLFVVVWCVLFCFYFILSITNTNVWESFCFGSPDQWWVTGNHFISLCAWWEFWWKWNSN